MRRLIALVVLAAALLASPAPAQEIRPVVIGYAGSLHSDILGEDRPIMVSTPVGYERGDQKYPVLYLLDGPGHFDHTVGTARFLAQQGQMPPVIVVAIANTQRTRDLTPETAADAERFPTAGGAGKFLDFIQQELFPFVEEQFRTQPYRILVGHSFGGLLAIDAMLHRTDMFDAWIAISPSLWWDDQRLVKETESFFSDRDGFNKSLFVTLGDEAGNMRSAYDAFVDVVQREKPDDLAFGHVLLADESHGTIPLRATIFGLKLVYRDWAIPPAAFAGADLDAIEKHAKKLSEKYGYEIRAPEAMVNQLGYNALGTGDTAKAIEIFTYNTRQYPESANVYDSLGEAYEAAGDLDQALKLFREAVDRGTAVRDPNVPVYQQHIQRAQAKLGGVS